MPVSFEYIVTALRRFYCDNRFFSSLIYSPPEDADGVGVESLSHEYFN